jgi:hypothetical protein
MPGEAMELLRTMLEEQFAVHTNRLTELTVYGRLSDHGGHDPDVLHALAEHARQGIAVRRPDSIIRCAGPAEKTRGTHTAAQPHCWSSANTEDRGGRAPTRRRPPFDLAHYRGSR